MPDRPNILLITSDQQHWDTLGVTNRHIRTPTLDRLASEGVRFERAYCSNPVCSPSRASIITGLYPAWHHCWTIGVKLPEDVPTVGDIFRKHGYFTALVGKAHFQPTRSTPGSESIETPGKLRELDFWRTFHGPFYGFERLEMTRGHADECMVGGHYALWMEEKGFTRWRDCFMSWPERKGEEHRRHKWDLPREFHYTTWTAERTIANVERAVEGRKPFFIWSSFHDPHPPYLTSEPWDSMYDPDAIPLPRHTPGEFDRMPPHFRKTQQAHPDFSMYLETEYIHGFHSHLVAEKLQRKDIAVYYGMISFMDWGIGRILEALERLGVADSTLVLFTTDHGHFLAQHGLTAKGAFHYEDLIRIPMLVRWPHELPAGTVSSALQSQVDFAPTFLAAAGMEIPGLMQGVSQLDVWRGKSPGARDHVICENRHEPTKVHLRTCVDARYKITVYRDHDYGEIFDLAEDPGELHNLWDSTEHASLKTELLHRFMLAELKREPTRMNRIAPA
jgi:uncharacterized sulfatase